MTSRSFCSFVLATLTLTAACGGNVSVASTGGPGAGGAGTGGAGAGGDGIPPEPCDPGVQTVCDYPGPKGTLGVGACKTGVKTCNADGIGTSECLGEVVPGAEVCATAIDETCDGEGACTGKLLWASEDISKSSNANGADIAADPWGNILVTGRFETTFNVAGLALEAEKYDGFVVKLAPDGKGLWARQAQGDAAGAAIASDAAGNVFVAGSFNNSVDLGGGVLKSEGFSDVFLAKYDPDGELRWSIRFGGPGHQWPEEMAVDAVGNIVIIGGLHDGADLGEGYKSAVGETDLFVIKLDAAGQRLWSKHFGATGYDYGMGVALDPGGAVVISGAYEGNLDLGGTPLSASESEDMFLAKFSPEGDHLFSLAAGGSGHDQGRSVAVDPAGNLVVAGLFTNEVDFGGGPLSAKGSYGAYMARYNAQGAYLDSQAFGNEDGTAYAVDVAVDSAGNAVLLGFLTGTVSFGAAPLSAAGDNEWAEDIFVAKYGPGGEHVYSKAFGDPARQRPYGLAVDSLGSALLTGDFQGTIDFGAGPLSTSGPQAWDIFIAKLAP